MAPAQYSPVATASAGPSDDLALQELDQETGAEKNTAQVPCPACEKPLPPGEIVCRHCGYIAQEGLMGKDKRVASKPRPTSWGGKHPSELTAIDFIKVAVSPQIFSAMIMLIIRTIGAVFLMFFILFVLMFGGGFILNIIASVLPIWASIPILFVVYITIAALIYGVIVKEAFAVCEAACFGHDAPRVDNWPTVRSGFFFILLNLMPVIAAILAGMGGGPVMGSVVYYLVAIFVVPMTFLSVSQSGGDWSGLNPIRIFNWMAKLFVPYLGIAAILMVESAVIIGLGIVGLAVVGVSGLLQKTTEGPDWAVLGMGAGVFLVVMILLLHPLVYMAAMLGMLYRKFEKSLVG